ncbi:MAG TPA: hypothetical protein VHW95_04555, partial [Steroidobacteraceae bacterium]|nr:hypothetical protein [Steroidobacteraceae bacterium]
VQPTWDFLLIVTESISLAPVLVLFMLRHLTHVVVIYVFILFSLLVWRIYYLVQYYNFGPGALFYKIDMPMLLLIVLGAISAAIVLVKLVFHFAAFIGRTLGSRPLRS